MDKREGPTYAKPRAWRALRVKGDNVMVSTTCGGVAIGKRLRAGAELPESARIFADRAAADAAWEGV